MMIALFSVVGANKAQAQIMDATDVVAAANNLVNIQVSGINVNVSDINVEDVIDVTNVLNNADIRVLSGILNDNTITLDNILNNALRDADIIKNNQVVVGILSDGTILVARQAQLR
ncbi:hypothetical protein DC20_01430 [Rufibacter tibetensis]|uniref:Uncharacterized protein n=2 Tax=Rufibacter tibetensis TaxID=512763 RepID=A0A0P0CRU5_9BACT|nr:hypothetical protein DC20_01430 [Rufibacter tibetensis]